MASNHIKSDVGRGALILVIAVFGLGILGRAVSAYELPQATVDPQYQNFNSINLNNLKNIPLPSLTSFSPTLPTGSFNISQFFNLGFLFSQQGLIALLDLVINILVAVTGVVVQILKLILSYLR